MSHRPTAIGSDVPSSWATLNAFCSRQHWYFVLVPCRAKGRSLKMADRAMVLRTRRAFSWMTSLLVGVSGAASVPPRQRDERSPANTAVMQMHSFFNHDTNVAGLPGSH